MDVHYHINIVVHLHQYGDAPVAPEKEGATGAVMLSDYLRQQLQLVADSRSLSTRRNYMTAVRSLQAYLGHDVPLSEVTAELLQGYERWLREHGVCLNTISCYMRSLRSLLHDSPDNAGQAFSHVFTGHTRTDKRSIPVDAINRLRKLQLPSDNFISLARDVFLFSFYAMGMPFVDVAHLLRSQVGPLNIVYRRQKTGHRVTIGLMPQLTEIMRRYRDSDSPYVFPLLHAGTEREYHVALGRYNRALHRLQRLAKIESPLTSYVVRHSWASAAYASNVDLPVIAQALGHANTKVTMTYIREINDDRVAKANETVANQLG